MTRATAILFAILAASSFGDVAYQHYIHYFDQWLRLPVTDDSLHSVTNARSIASLGGYIGDLREYCGKYPRTYERTHWDWLKTAPARLLSSAENHAIWSGMLGTFAVANASIDSSAAVGLLGTSDIDLTTATPNAYLRCMCYDKFRVLPIYPYTWRACPDDSADCRANASLWISVMNEYRAFYGLSAISTNHTAWASAEWEIDGLDTETYALSGQFSNDELEYLAKGEPLHDTTPYYNGYWNLAIKNSKYGCFAWKGHNAIAVERKDYTFRRDYELPASKIAESVGGGLVKVTIDFDELELVDESGTTALTTNGVSGTIAIERRKTDKTVSNMVYAKAIYHFLEAAYSSAGIRTNNYVYCSNRWALVSADDVTVDDYNELSISYSTTQRRMLNATAQAQDFDYPAKWFNRQLMAPLTIPEGGTARAYCRAVTSRAGSQDATTRYKNVANVALYDTNPAVSLTNVLNSAIASMASLNNEMWEAIDNRPEMYDMAPESLVFAASRPADFTVYDTGGEKVGYASELGGTPVSGTHATTNVVTVTAEGALYHWDYLDESVPTKSSAIDIWTSGVNHLTSDF